MSDQKCTINAEDAALFQEMTQGVRPLNPQNRVDLSSQRLSPDSRPAHKREMESLPPPWFSEAADLNPSSLPVDAEEILFFARGQLSHATLRRLRRGELCSDLELDLHGLTTAQSTKELSQLIHQTGQRQRCFHLIHGKGQRSSEQIPILKSYLNQWLRQRPEVLAFCSARQKDGGAGALYVLLKRNR